MEETDQSLTITTKSKTIDLEIKLELKGLSVSLKYL